MDLLASIIAGLLISILIIVLITTHFFRKHILNPVMLKFAGTNHSPISVIYHVGRRSGRSLRTPIIVEPIDGGFVFALTYGPMVNWYRNIKAAGECRLRCHGKEYVLDKPEPIDTQTALPAFPPFFRMVLRIRGIDHFMRMRVRSHP